MYITHAWVTELIADATVLARFQQRLGAEVATILHVCTHALSLSLPPPYMYSYMGV